MSDLFKKKERKTCCYVKLQKIKDPRGVKWNMRKIAKYLNK